MDRNKKQDYPGQYLDMWSNILQGKEKPMDIDALVARVKILEQRLAGQDERIREAVREMAIKSISLEKKCEGAINELSLNVPSLLMFLDLKKQVEELKERLGE